MLLIDRETKEVFRVDDSGAQEKLCVLEDPTRIRLCRGAELTIGSAMKCLSTVMS